MEMEFLEARLIMNLFTEKKKSDISSMDVRMLSITEEM